MYDNVERFRENLSNTEYLNNGVRHVYNFDNGYGASVIKHDYSYGGKKVYGK